MRYAGIPLSEIAGYESRQLRWVIGRKRDKCGALVRGSNELPPGVEVDDEGMRIVTRPIPLARAFSKAKKHYGVPERLAETQWHQFLRENPRFGVGGVESDSTRPLR